MMAIEKRPGSALFETHYNYIAYIIGKYDHIHTPGIIKDFRDREYKNTGYSYIWDTVIHNLKMDRSWMINRG